MAMYKKEDPCRSPTIKLIAFNKQEKSKHQQAKMAPGFRLFPLLLTLVLTSLEHTGAYPTIPLSSFFTNAVLRAQHLHQLAADIYRDFDVELLRFSLALIQSWIGPLGSLSRVFTNSLVFSTSDRLFEKLKDLEEGIMVLLKELEDAGFRGSPLLRLTYDKFDVNLRSDDSLMKNYGLLACFKKDMHKVETYLKLMKCRRFVESNCTL
ncbi:somatotropin-1-like [Polypterus senegalus]|uniref:somatotropin-1-like n=1 Tax=Polypterus senegalus TaxID=55291 RepID=UPI00196349D8|nr:somatotropin-1-like [Polypterus senegalus]